MDGDFDLFGNPYRTAKKDAGRPEHIPTEENIINIMVLLAAGHTVNDIAKVVGVSVPTLRKHYFHLTKHRDIMLARLKAKLRTAQIQQGLAGNAAALSAAIRMLDTVSAEQVEKNLRNRAANAPAAAKGYVSKKELRLERAQSIGGRYSVPLAPRLVASNGSAMIQSDDE